MLRLLRGTSPGEHDVEAETRTKEPPANRRRGKRKRRFGSIYSRKWGSGRRTWSAKWFCRTERRWLTRAFDTEKEAKDFLDEVEKRILAEAYEVPPTLSEAQERAVQASVESAPRDVPTLVGYAKDVIERRFEPVLAKGTMGVYRAALRAWTEYFGERDGQRAVRLDEITPARWLDYRAWRATTRNSSYGKKTTVSPRTLNADQQSVIRILNEAVLDGHLDANPLAGIKKLRETRRPRRYLTKKELGALITNCPEHFRPFLLTAIYTGARKGELTALRWSDIDFTDAKISLYRPKTGTADLLDLHGAVAGELERLRDERPNVSPDDHVFLSTRGTPFVEIRRSWELALKAAGLGGRKGLTPHSLRHSFATHFLQNGGAVTDLQQQLGHAELATTQVYASALSKRRRAAVMALDFAETPPVS